MERRGRGKPPVSKANVCIRKKSVETGIPLWMVAEALGKPESRFSVMLRHELPEETQSEIIATIEQLAKERGEQNECGR